MAALTILLMLAGCANTEFERNDGPGPGIRYYRPRPYVVVLEPFPVAAEHVLVPGTVRPDGLVISIDGVARGALASLGVQMPEGAEPHSGETVKLFVPTSVSSPAGGRRLTSGERGSDQNEVDGLFSRAQVDQLLQEVLDAGKTVDPKSTPSGGLASGWIRKGDLAEFRDTVNNLFDIRYLPDFDEDYRLTGNAGLGQASLDAYLTRGWAAHHLGKDVDRRELGQLVIANVQAVLDIARAAGKAALITSTGGLGTAAVLTSGEPGAEREQVEADVQPVMLQITVIEYAVPGVYPILKQSEMLTIEMDMIVQAPTQTMMVNGARTTVSFPPTKSRISFKALPVLGSIQQPASAALPVAYRTHKQLIVAVAGAGGGNVGRVEGGSSGIDVRELASDLQAKIHMIEESGQFDVRATVEAGQVHINVIRPDPENEDWAAVRSAVLSILARLPPAQQKLVKLGPNF